MKSDRLLVHRECEGRHVVGRAFILKLLSIVPSGHLHLRKAIS